MMISVTAAQMGRIDELAVSKCGIKIEEMMELAGSSLVRLASDLHDGLNGKRVAILVGKGNNGGGGAVAAGHMANRGADVVALVSVREGLGEAVSARLVTLEAMGVELSYYGEAFNIHSTLSGSDLVIDALIGYGLKGNPRPPMSGIIEAANESGINIMSLDLPSGLDATTGKAYESCIVALETLTLALPKTGLMMGRAGQYVGNLYPADIGIPRELYLDLSLDVGDPFREGSIVRIY
jgi:NAD(P)H-hydrate epimerase